MKLKRLMAALTFAAAGVATANAVAAVDPAIPTYTKTTGVSGNLSSVGSDTLANLMTLWAEAYKKEYPNVNIQIQAAGSSTAPPALTEGTANLGPMSRKMKDVELQAFEQKYGYKPTAIPVAVDALAVFVHKDNPIKGLTMARVDAIFSSTRLCGGKADVKTWGDLGVTGDWPTSQYSCSAVTRYRAPTATSRKKPCAKATSSLTSTNSLARLRSCSRSAPR